MTRYVSAIPAYGRDYQTEADVRADWEAGKDFLTQDLIVHGYVNKDDLPGDVQLNIRYNRKQDICVIEATQQEALLPNYPFFDDDDLFADEGRGTGPDRYPSPYFD